jgi:hypothetical protein
MSVRSVPAFASRVFRHGFIFFNRKSGIRAPTLVQYMVEQHFIPGRIPIEELFVVGH